MSATLPALKIKNAGLEKIQLQNLDKRWQGSSIHTFSGSNK